MNIARARNGRAAILSGLVAALGVGVLWSILNLRPELLEVPVARAVCFVLGVFAALAFLLGMMLVVDEGGGS